MRTPHPAFGHPLPAPRGEGSEEALASPAAPARSGSLAHLGLFERGEDAQERPGIDRLDHVEIEAGLHRARFVALLAPTGPRDQDDPSAPGVSSDLPGGVLAV